MCDNCVKAGRMTEAEAAQQREEFTDILGALTGATGQDPMEIIDRVAIQSIAEQFIGMLAERGYEISLGMADGNGNVMVGIVKANADSGPAYVLAEFSGENVREMLEGK